MTTTHEGLAETALAFCREVLGWDTVIVHQTWERGVESPPELCTPTDAGGEVLRYTDLNTVMEAVTQWCDRINRSNRLLLDILYLNEGDQRSFAVSFYGDAGVELGGHSSDNPCLAILTAALEASRKLRGRL